MNTQQNADRLLLELARCEDQLKIWLDDSPTNAGWFAKDPVSALRAAGLGLHEELLQDLAQVIGSLKEKLVPAA